MLTITFLISEKYICDSLDKTIRLCYHYSGSTETSSWKAAGMSSFIHIVDSQSLFNRLSWLPSHNRSSTGAGLLRWVARTILCIISYRHTAYRTPHTIISQIGLVCQTTYRILHTSYRLELIKIVPKYANKFVLSPVTVRRIERDVGFTLEKEVSNCHTN